MSQCVISNGGGKGIATLCSVLSLPDRAPPSALNRGEEGKEFMETKNESAAKLIEAYHEFNNARIRCQNLAMEYLEKSYPEAELNLGNAWRYVFELVYGEKAIEAASIIMPSLAFRKWEITTQQDEADDE